MNDSDAHSRNMGLGTAPSRMDIPNLAPPREVEPLLPTKPEVSKQSGGPSLVTMILFVVIAAALGVAVALLGQ